MSVLHSTRSMHLFVERQIRGGISQIPHRYAEVKNKDENILYLMQIIYMDGR